MYSPNICFCREIGKILCGYPLLSGAMFTYANSGQGMQVAFHYETHLFKYIENFTSKN